MFYDLERPLDFVRDIERVLADDGIWVFEQSYLPAMLAAKSYDTICHEHLEYYALKQIVYIAREAGLKIIDIEINDANGGSFCVTACKLAAPFPEAGEIVDRILADEERAGFDTDQPFLELQSAMDLHKNELTRLLQDIRKDGRLVLGYGASTKGNVLLQYCGIDRNLLPAIAEVNEDKFGSFTPGSKIPIIAEPDARAMRPDYFLVLPWHFRDSIVDREAAFLAGGGTLIFPLPELSAVSLLPARAGNVSR